MKKIKEDEIEKTKFNFINISSKIHNNKKIGTKSDK
jgi:hypothetical protein